MPCQEVHARRGLIALRLKAFTSQSHSCATRVCFASPHVTAPTKLPPTLLATCAETSSWHDAFVVSLSRCGRRSVWLRFMSCCWPSDSDRMIRTVSTARSCYVVWCGHACLAPTPMSHVAALMWSRLLLAACCRGPGFELRRMAASSPLE